MNTDLTIDNFTERTGFRFRITKRQAARIILTELPDSARQAFIDSDVEQVAGALNAHNAKGKPLNWVKDFVEILPTWDDSLSLTREQAFQEFIAEGGLQRLEDRAPDVPDAIYLEPGLTLDNFADRVKAAIGTVRRFRVSRDQHARIGAGTLTREQALTETIAAKQADAATATEATEVTETVGS